MGAVAAAAAAAEAAAWGRLLKQERIGWEVGWQELGTGGEALAESWSAWRLAATPQGCQDACRRHSPSTPPSLPPHHPPHPLNCPRYQRGSEICERFAQSLHHLTAIEERELFDFGSRGEASPVVLVLDRRDDPVTPLLSQWTYQVGSGTHLPGCVLSHSGAWTELG